MQKRIENAVTVMEQFVSLSIRGQIYNFRREAVSVKISKIYTSLWLTFNIDGYEFEFLKGLPANQFVGLKKAFINRFKVVKESVENIFNLNKLIKNIPAILVALAIVAATVMMVLAHYLWVPELPPIVGVFFLCMSPLVFCNIFPISPSLTSWARRSSFRSFF